MSGGWGGTPAEFLETIEERGVDYIVLTDVWIDLIRAEAALYPQHLAFYESLLEAYPSVAVFDHDDAARGGRITILGASD
jgi:hypothetical protein